MKRSNLRLRSNVHVRNPQLRLREDHQFLPRVRGYGGVRALLRSFGLLPDQIRHDNAEVLKLVQLGKLTRAQHEALKWGVPCAHCNCIPCGVNFRGDYEFRCEKPGCSSSPKSVSRRIAVPLADLQECRCQPEMLLNWAIESCNRQFPQLSLQPPFNFILIRVPPTAALSYSNEQLSALLVYGIRQGQAR